MRAIPGRSACAAVLAAAALAFFWPSLASPFIDLESLNVVLQHRGFQGWENLPRLASPSYFGAFGEGGYRPLTTLVYFLARQVSGTDPLGYKLVKFLLHGGNSVLVYAVALLLLRHRGWALLAACHYLLRLSYPAFDGMAFLPDILAGFFSLAAAFTHLRDVRGDGPKAYAPFLAALLYLCALLSKEMSVTLPVSLLAHDILAPCSKARSAKALVARHAPLWAAMALFLAVLRWGVRAESFYGRLGWAWPQPWWLPASLLLDYVAAYFVPSGFIPGWLLALAAAALGAAVLRRAPAGDPCALRHLAKGERPRQAWGSPSSLPWRELGFLGAWAGLALLPVVNVLPFPRFLTYFKAADPRYLASAGAALACAPAALAAWPGCGRAGRLLLALLMAAGMAFQARQTVLTRRAWSVLLPDEMEVEIAFVAIRRSAAPPHDFPMLESRFAKLMLSLPSLKARAPELYRSMEDGLLAHLPEEEARLLIAYFGREALYEDPREARHAMRLMMASNFDGMMDWHRAELAFRKGIALLEAGKPLTALPELKTARRLNQTHYPACYSLAEAFRVLNDDPRARLQAPLRRAENVRAFGDPAPLLQASACADLWRNTVNRGLSETTYRDADATLSSQRLLAQADDLVRARLYGQAQDAYQKVVDEVGFQWPEHWTALRERRLLDTGARQAYNEAMDAFLAGDPDRALEGFGRVIRTDPGFAEAFVSRAALRAKRGERAKALQDCRAALKSPLTSQLKALVYSTMESLKTSPAKPQTTSKVERAGHGQRDPPDQPRSDER
ncbi:MAG: hypothetical protein HY748_03505 [Elusimicrobia bacterium]|nr:hypothetical protein [Elusimicrobiota bacterium]